MIAAILLSIKGCFVFSSTSPMDRKEELLRWRAQRHLTTPHVSGKYCKHLVKFPFHLKFEGKKQKTAVSEESDG